MRNVEIKAPVENKEKLIRLAQCLCSGQTPIVLYQHDTFFKSPNGRLKLRISGGDSQEKSELIYYDREDSEGPKLSEYHKVSIEDHKSLKETLSLSMGILGEVKKRRMLFIYGQTRIHIDEVENLGSFVELEVCLRNHQSAEEGQKIAEEVMGKLDIDQSQLISGAYMDAMLKKI